MVPHSIQVLTYNIHKGFSPGKFLFKLPQMKDALQLVNASVIFLQEVQGLHTRQQKRIEKWPESSQCEFLAEQLWPHFAYGKNAIYQEGHHGNAILSKYPFRSWENLNLTNISRASRSLLHGVLQIDALDVHVLCVHLGLFKQEREEQVSILCDRISQKVPADAPLIIAGDFNDWRHIASERLEEELAVKEVFQELHGSLARTFPAWRPTLQVDRIYFRGLKLIAGQCLDRKPWITLSDHLPLYAEFGF